MLKHQSDKYLQSVSILSKQNKYHHLVCAAAAAAAGIPTPV